MREIAPEVEIRRCGKCDECLNGLLCRDFPQEFEEIETLAEREGGVVQEEKTLDPDHKLLLDIYLRAQRGGTLLLTQEDARRILNIHFPREMLGSAGVCGRCDNFTINAHYGPAGDEGDTSTLCPACITELRGEGPLEALAELEHQQWAHWMRYLQVKLKTIIEYEAGSEAWNRIEADPVMQRWVRQMETPYKDLSPKEKDSDREWAQKVLDLLEDSK
jgi:L-rhamnose mutarotase